MKTSQVKPTEKLGPPDYAQGAPFRLTIPVNPKSHIRNNFWFENTNPGRRGYAREHVLLSLIQKYGWTSGAELGLWKGRVFLFLLEQCPNLNMIGVDFWGEQPEITGSFKEGYENYVGLEHNVNEKLVRHHAAQFGNRAIIIKDKTKDACKQVEDKSLDFVFIDADHSGEGVRKDIIDWSPKVKDSGWIIGHDIGWKSVNDVVNELLPKFNVGANAIWARKKIL